MTLVAAAWLVGVAVLTADAVTDGGDSQRWTFGLTVLYLSLFWVLVFHETGHVLAGLALGLKFVTICVFPVRLVRFRGRLRLRLDYYLGQGACIADDPHGLARKMAIILAAGPLTGFVLSMACWMPLLFGFVPSGTKCAMLMRGIGIWGLVVNGLSLVPDGNKSDGNLLWMLHRGGSSVRQLWATAMLGFHLMAGARFEELPDELVVDATAQTDRAEWGYWGAHMAYFRAIRLGWFDEAERHLATMETLTCKSKTLAAMRRPTALESAFFLAWYRADAPRARKVLDEAPRGRIAPTTVARAKCAVLIVDGREAEARAVLATTMKTLPSLERLEEDDPTARIIASDLRALAARLGVAAR